MQAGSESRWDVHVGLKDGIWIEDRPWTCEDGGRGSGGFKCAAGKTSCDRFRQWGKFQVCRERQVVQVVIKGMQVRPSRCARETTRGKAHATKELQGCRERQVVAVVEGMQGRYLKVHT